MELATDTRDNSYTDILNKLGLKQQTVYLALLAVGNPMTNNEIANYLSLPINTVTPRIFELREAGLIIDAGVRKSTITGKPNHIWKIK